MAKKKRIKTVPFILNDFDFVGHLLDEVDEKFNKSLEDMPFTLLLQNYADYCEAIGILVKKRKTDRIDPRIKKLYDRKYLLADRLNLMMFNILEESSRANYHYDKMADEHWELKNKKKLNKS
jgi:hypothetical protein